MKTQHNDTRLRDKIAIVLTLIMSILLTVSSFLISIRATVFVEGFVFKQLEDIDYVYLVQDYFMEVVTSRAVLYGVDVTYLSDAFTTEKMKEDIFRSTRMLFDGQRPDFFVEELSDDLKEHLIAYVDDQGMTLTVEVEAGIDELTGKLVNDYTRIMQVPLFRNYVEAKNQFGRIFWWAIAGLSVLIGVIVTLILRLYKHRHRALRLLSHGTSAVGLMSLIVLVPIYLSKAYQRIQISPRFFNLLLAETIESALLISILIALSWFVASFFLIEGSERSRKKAFKKNPN